jgi:hypothetical protein
VADNTTINLGSGGNVIATDDIAGVHHQRVKIEWGPDNTVNETDNVTGKRLPVNVSECAQLPLVLGTSGGLKIEDVTPSVSIVLQASQVAGNANATTTRTTTTGLGGYQHAIVLINITAAGTATGVLQLFLQDSVDGGTTWNDLISSNTFTFGSSGTTQVFCLVGDSATSHPPGTAQQLETLPAGTARQGPFGDRIRVREKVSGVTGSPTGPTYVISSVFKR